MWRGATEDRLAGARTGISGGAGGDSREQAREGEGRGSESAATIPTTTVSWTLCQSSGPPPVGTGLHTDGHHFGQSGGGRGRN